MKLLESTVRTAALVVVAAALSGCQTMYGSSTASLSFGGTGKNIVPTVARTTDNAATPDRSQDGIVDEGAFKDRVIASKGKVSSTSYNQTMDKLDKQLATASTRLVVARGLMKSCEGQPIMQETGMDEFFTRTDKLFGKVMARAFTMESKRLKAEGKSGTPAVMGFLLSQTAALNTNQHMIDFSKKVEDKYISEGKPALSDADRLKLGCALLTRSGERKSIARRIATPLLEYFVMMKHAHPVIYQASNLDDGDMVEGIRVLTRL